MTLTTRALPRLLLLACVLPCALATCSRGAEGEGEGDVGEGEGEGGEGEGDVGEGEGEGDACPIDGEGVLGIGEACTFNADCGRDLRCACTDGTCVCESGPRGCGASGVDECIDGNDCVTSLCVEGQGGAFFCSGLCATDDDCGPALPVCADIAFVGRICIREAP
jgi:hypothetical protein